MSNEKRKFIRILEKAEMTYRTVTDQKTTGTLTANLSKGGLRFFVNQFIPNHSMLRVTITLKEIPFSFETLAEVRWIKSVFTGEQFEIGVQFKDIPQEAVKQLQRYMDKKTGTIEKIMESDKTRSRQRDEPADFDLFEIDTPENNSETL